MRALPLIIAIMALALFATPALAADVTIPINKDYREGDMVVHLQQVSITDKPMGNVYSPDPDNTVWPKLVFTYENKGSAAINGNLEIAFFDDKGNKYPSRGHITDITMNPVSPGKTSDVRFVEAAVLPKDTKVTSFTVYEGTKATTFDIPYEKAVSATSSATAQGSSASRVCLLPALLPLTIIGMACLTRKKR